MRNTLRLLAATLLSVVVMSLGAFTAVSAQDGPDYVGRRAPSVSTGVGSANADPAGNSHGNSHGSSHGSSHGNSDGNSHLPLTGIAIGALVAVAGGLIVGGRLLWAGADRVSTRS